MRRLAVLSVAMGRLLLALLVMQCAWLPVAASAATEEALAERRIKAAYLHRFAGYVEWPDAVFARPDSPLTIGIWGNDEMAEDLARLVANRSIDGRRVEVRRVKDGDSLAGLQMLFVSKERAARPPEPLSGIPPMGLLVVTESPNGLKGAAVINFVMSNGQIRFELSLQAADKYGLKLSSRLVAVAMNAQEKR